MAEPTYRKGHYVATVFTEQFDNGQFQGMVSMERADKANSAELHRAEAFSSSRTEAFEEAHALAHRLLAQVEDV